MSFFLIERLLDALGEFCCRLDVSENGLPAVVRLANGDMRKALNILQVRTPALFLLLDAFE